MNKFEKIAETYMI